MEVIASRQDERGRGGTKQVKRTKEAKFSTVIGRGDSKKGRKKGRYRDKTGHEEVVSLSHIA